MREPIDLQQLWHSQPPPETDLETFLGLARSYQARQRNRRLRMAATMALTLAGIAWVFSRLEDRAWTTTVGVALIATAILFYLALFFRSDAGLTRRGYSLPAQDYLRLLLRSQNRQRFLYRTGLNGYFLFFSAGLALYMIQFLRRMTWPLAAVSVAVTAGWIFYSWFTLRPRRQRKEEAALAAMIRHGENLIRQSEQD